MSYAFENEYVQCSIETLGNDEVPKLHVKGYVKQMAATTHVIISAPKSIDRMTNYTGSGLPFPCAQVAFENTPNIAKLTDPSGSFELTFTYPNGYYTTDAFTKIPPSIFVTLHWKDKAKEDTVVQLPLNDPLPLRTLSYRPNFYKGPEYYAAKTDIIGVRGAEATMRTLSYAKAEYDIA